MTMEEIKKRLTEIAAEIEQLGDAITEERLTALEKEARELLDKQEAMKLNFVRMLRPKPVMRGPLFRPILSTGSSKKWSSTAIF